MGESWVKVMENNILFQKKSQTMFSGSNWLLSVQLSLSITFVIFNRINSGLS